MLFKIAYLLVRLILGLAVLVFRTDLVGLGNTIRVLCGLSGGDVVLVGESAYDLLPADPEPAEVDRFRRIGVSLSRGELAEGTVRPGLVIVPQVLGQHPSQVALIDDQYPVQELPAQGADDPLADRVRPGVPAAGWSGS